MCVKDGPDQVLTSGGNGAMVTRRGSGFLFSSVLEDGEMVELALTPAQIGTRIHALLQTALMEDAVLDLSLIHI